MKTKNSLTPSEVAVIKAEWSLPKGERPILAELAARFNVSVITVRRALADYGMVQLKGHKSIADTEILDFLQAQGLNDLKKLRNFVVKARQAKSVK